VFPCRVAVRETLAVLGKYIDPTTDWAVTKTGTRRAVRLFISAAWGRLACSGLTPAGST
jgi:hypothetical protein